MSSVTKLIIALRRETLRRHPEYDVDSPAALAAMAIWAEEPWAGLEEQRILPERAAVLLWRASTRFFDSAQRALIVIAPGDATAVQWVAEQLRALAPRFAATLEIRVDVAHEGLIPQVANIGLEPRMTIHHGDPKEALKALREGPLDAKPPGELRIEVLQDPEHVEPVVTLLREFFRANPRLGYLSPAVGLTPALQTRLDEFARSNLEKLRKRGTACVLLHGEEVVGHGGFGDRDDPLMGKVGGMVICLAPAFQGRGLGKLVYEWLLERMVELEVRVMIGRTANGAIKHLARRMRRPVRGWQLEPLKFADSYSNGH